MPTEEPNSVIDSSTVSYSITTTSTPIARGYPVINEYTPTPVATNTSPTPFEPTAEFKNFINKIVETIPFLTYPMSYEPKTVLIQPEELSQELKDDASNYQTAMPSPRKLCLSAIITPLKTITNHLQSHKSHPNTAMNLNPCLNAEASLKPCRFQKAKNYTTTTSYTDPALITSIPASKSTPATFSDTPIKTPTLISTLPSYMPSEVPI